MAELRALRASVDVFAEAIGHPLAVFQAESLRFESRITALVAGRQLGKSRALALAGLWAAFRKPEQHALIVSASEDAARRLLDAVRRMAQGSELLRGSVVDEQAALVRLSNGSAIRSVAASERAIRGWTVDALLIDEAALLPASLITDAAMPTTTARPQALIVLASTASVAEGPFYDLARAGEVGSEHVRTFRWVSRLADGDCDAPWVAASAIEADRATMHPIRFEAEHRAVFAGAADSLFAARVLEAATVDYEPDALGSMLGPARVLGGVDWGASVDRSAFVAIGRLAVGGDPVFAVRAVRRWDAGAPLHSVAEEIAASPAHFDALSSEVNGLGAGATEILWRAIVGRAYEAGGGRPESPVVLHDDSYGVLEGGIAPRPQRRRRAGFVTTRRSVTTTAAMKAGGWSVLSLLIGQGRLLLPASERELLSELRLLKVELSPASGVERIEASRGHDDLADALMLASAPVKRGEGRWGSLLGELAARRGLWPGSSRLEPGEQVDAEGVRFPRRPVWASVAGDEVTRPPAESVAMVGVELVPSLRERVQAEMERLIKTTNGGNDE